MIKLHCPTCSDAIMAAREKYWPKTVLLPISPKRGEDFDKGHVNESGEYICNYHGNSEFSPDHDCIRNACEPS